MTVSELIAKLQEMPQGLLVYGHDGEEGPYFAEDATIVIVGDTEQEEYTNQYGMKRTRPKEGTYKQFEAVVIA